MRVRILQILAVVLLAAPSCHDNKTPTENPPQQALQVVVSGTGTGAISSSPAGIACNYAGAATNGSCSASFVEGTVVTLTATAAAGHTFAGWSGACTGTGSCQVTMSQAQSVTATFTAPILTFQLSVAGAGTGSGSVASSPGAIACSISAGSASGICSASYTSGTVVTLTAAAVAGHTFGGWSGACTGTGNCQVTMNQARSVTATFTAPVPTFQLSVTLGGTGNGSVSSSPTGIACSILGGVASGACTASYNSGTVVTLTAGAAAGHTFAGWSGACTGTGSCQVTMSQAQTVSANFTAPIPTFQLGVTGGGTGNGNVTSSPTGISCSVIGGVGTGTCTNSFNSGAVVTLTASAFNGYTFTGWSGACTGTGNCQVTMSQPRSVSASFTPVYQLSVTGSGTGNGSVTSTPGGIVCTLSAGTASGTCSASLISGTVVTLTPAAAAGHTFAGWSGACTGTGGCQVTMSQARSVTAAFTALVSSQHIAVPAYFRNWNTMLSYAPTVNVVILNPHNGPFGDDYTTEVNQAKSKGVPVYGYVYTKYANTKLDFLRNPNGALDRMVDSVKAEIDEYYRHYPTITGIFLDEVTDSCGSVVTYYKPIADHIRSHGGKVILNPGGAVPSCYADANIADIVVTFESTFDNYKNHWSIDNRDWETNARSGKIWHIVHTTTSAELSEALTLSRSRSAGYIYVTNLTEKDNTFGSLPPYFSTEVANVQSYHSP